METSVENSASGTAEVTITVSGADVDAAIAEAYKKSARGLSVSGFRKGKAPRSLIDSTVGRDSVLALATELLSKMACEDALLLEGLLTYGEPRIDVDTPVTEGTPYTFKVFVQLRPELSLSGHGGIAIPVPPAVVTDAEIDHTLDVLRRRFTTFEPVEGRAAEHGDVVLMSIEAPAMSERGTGVSMSRQPYQIGSGAMPSEFDDCLLGARAGEALILDLPVPTQPGGPAEGKTARFQVKVHEVRAKYVPPVGVPMARTLGYSDVAEMRRDVANRLEGQRAERRTKAIRDGARKALASRLQGDIPQDLVQQSVTSSLQAFTKSLMEAGDDLVEYCTSRHTSPPQMMQELSARAERELRESLALEALFRSLGLSMDDVHVEQIVAEMAVATGLPVERIREGWASGPLRLQMMPVVQARIAEEWLLGHVDLCDIEYENASDSITSEADRDADADVVARALAPGE